MFVHPLYICMPHMFICPQGCTHPPYAPILFCTSVFLEALHVVGGGNGLPFGLGDLPYTTSGGASPSITPHTQLLVPCASVCFRDISMLCGHFPSVEGFGGVLHQLGGWGASALEMSTCSFLYIFCSALCLTLRLRLWLLLLQLQWYLLAYLSSHSAVPISDSGSFSDRVSSKLGSVWHGSTTTLDAKRLWRCSWLSFCATAANSIFNASSSLCLLCYGFSTGRFHFQSWASYHFVSYICLVSILVSAFYF